MRGIVLTGGGARGAYQAGVIQGLVEILCQENSQWPFPILSGTSAGAINASFIGTSLGTKNVQQMASSLHDLWASLRSHHVYRNDPVTMALNGMKWLQMLSSGGLFPSEKGFSLLRTDPLRELLRKEFDFSALPKAISNGQLKAIGVTAVSYNSGIGRTFFYAGPEAMPWKRTKREGVVSLMTSEHVMASAAIPILFPPIKIDQEYYGDGSLRDYTPLSAAIHMGAKKICVIGVRKAFKNYKDKMGPPGPAKIFSMILNGLLLDALDLDLERLDRINHTVEKLERLGEKADGLGKIDVLAITPSDDIGDMAAQHFTDLPKSVQYFLSGLGGVEDTSDLASYILFEAPFTRRLLELGRKDALQKRQEILDWYSR